MNHFELTEHYGIPWLDPTKQATEIPLPSIRWGRYPHRKVFSKGSIHFYTDDWRFNKLAPKVNHGCPDCRLMGRYYAVYRSEVKVIIEPNFSVYNELPRAEAVWNTYRKRWLASTWQRERNIQIIVDINVGSDYADLNLLGVPPGWRAYATRKHAGVSWDELRREFDRAQEHAGPETILFALYGGGRSAWQFCQDQGWIWIPEECQLHDRRKTWIREAAPQAFEEVV